MNSHDSTAVVLADVSGTIRYWSAGATTLFGHSESVGETLDVIVPPEFRERHWAGFHQAMATGESPISGGRLNIPVRCAGGAVRIFPGTFSVVWDAYGRPIGAIASWTERRGDEVAFSPVSQQI